MTNNFFSQIGLGGVDIGILIVILLFLIVLLFILLIVTMVKQSNLKKRYEGFMLGGNGRSMEEEIRNLFYDIDYLKKETDSNRKEIRHIYKRLEGVFQKVGLVKYDALHQMGGKLSFALALLDEKNNGFLMNSVHSTEGSYCYIKEIREGSCEIELSTDEQKALMQALEQSYVRNSRKSSEAAPSAERKKRRAAEEEPQQSPKQVYSYAPAADEEDDYAEDPDLLEAEALIAGLSDQKPLRVAAESGEKVTVKKKAAAPAKKRIPRTIDDVPSNMSHVSVKKVSTDNTDYDE